MEAMPSRAVVTPIGTLGLAGSDAGLSRVLWSAKGAPRRQLRRPRRGRVAARGVLRRRAASSSTCRSTWAGRSSSGNCWLALATIPYGQTVSYGEQARRLGLGPDAARAVGAANGQNPLPLVLPCHRVIGANGSLTGFGGGLHLKRFLLEHEGALLPIG